MRLRPTSSDAACPKTVSAAGFMSRIVPFASISNTAIGARSEKSASLRPEAWISRCASSSSWIWFSTCRLSA
jgi:hypothetical protein